MYKSLKLVEIFQTAWFEVFQIRFSNQLIYQQSVKGKYIPGLATLPLPPSKCEY